MNDKLLEQQQREDQRRLDDQRRDDLRRANTRRDDDLRRLDESHALDRKRIERRHSDDTLLADMRASADPETREIAVKIGRVLDARERAEERERGPAREPADHDPGWLNRWEREGALTALSPAEREKLKAIDREDPYGRSQREAFLPREVLAIRAKSDRQAEARVQEHHQQHEAGEHKQEPQEQKR